MKENIILKQKTYMDQYVGIQLPLIYHGDFVLYVRVPESTKAFPPIPHYFLLIDVNGNTITSYEKADKALIVDKSVIDRRREERYIRQMVDDELMSKKSKIPIYGYSTICFDSKKPKIFNILENVALIPRIKALNDIHPEKGNLLDKVTDKIGLTKIHSLESILRHFISEEEIMTLNTDEKRDRIKNELTIRHHILGDRIRLS